MKDVLYGGAGGYGMTCDFDGYQNTKAYDGKRARHEGIDFQFKIGENNIHNVYSLIDGEVIGTGGPCNRIAIYDQEYDKTVIYLHVSNIKVGYGDTIKKGDWLAKESNQGPGIDAIHTHVEVVNGRNFEKSSRDSKLDNSDPYPYWIKKMNEEEYIIINKSNTKISAKEIPVPITKKQGTPFEFFQGTISANTGIAFTAAAVLDSSGKAIKFKYKYHGDSKTVSINASNAFDSLIDYSTLAPGKYTLKLYATCKKLQNKNFISDVFATLFGNMLIIYDGSFTVSGGTSRNASKLSRKSAGNGRLKTDKYGNTFLLYSSQKEESNFYNASSSHPTGTYKITAKSGLNARSKPSANSKKLSGWSYGTTVSVTATDGNWGYTSRGWICLDYAQFISGPASSYDSNVSYGTGNYVVSTTAGLNCRRGAGTNFGVIKALPHGTNFSVTKTDGAWGYSPEYGGWLCLQYASYESALTPILPVPAMPKISSSTSSEIGVGEVISLSWDAVDTADKYNVKLIEPSTAKVVKSLSVSGTSASVTVPYAGVFNISVSASNSQHTGEEAVLRGFWAYSPLTVTFKSWDGKVISKQSVAFGKDATLPKAPARTGYTFTDWSGNYKAIKEDTVITAKYTRNKYNVNFYDYDGSLLTTQSVYYGDNAVAPKYEAPTGYSFVKWNRSFNNITSETNVKAVISWTSLYPLEISTKSAVQRNNKSYIVTSIVNNSPNAVSNAKVIAVIKTKENKLLATVESKNISLAKGEVKNLTLSATYGGMATRAELFVVKADNEKIPLASQLSVKVDPGTAWTSWSTSTPPSDALASEKRTEYRYRDKEFKTSSSSSLSGWTKYNTTWVWGSYGSTQGPIYSNPGSSDSRKSWSEQYVSSYGTTKHYYYFRYANSSGSSGNDIKTGSYTNYQELDLTYKLTNRSSTTGGSGTKGWKVFYKSSNYNDSSTGNYRTYWYKSEADVTDYSKPINGTRWYYQDRSKVYTYHYYQWKKWSDWSTTAYTSNNDRQIETRTVYRYVENKSDNIETTGGKARTISGSVNQSYTNRQALLFIASKDGVSQFVGQTQIGANGSYSFAFKLKDEPSAASGDYTVMLGIEGTSAAFELNPIKAPVPEYKVKFVDHDGTVVSEQTVKQGENAAVPAPLNREGYRFIGWDKSFTNIQGNTTLTALYKIKTFEVVFVDELNNTTSTVKYNYADALVPPEVKTNDAYNFLGWDAVLEGKTKVTENMVVSAKFEKKVFNVKFLDFDGSVLNSQSIEYGEPVVIPELKDRDEYVFISWNIPGDLNYLTQNMTISPYFEFRETVATPIASITTGTYDGAQTVNLSCDTQGAQIYYTLDGSDPLEISSEYGSRASRSKAKASLNYNGILYTGPFALDSSAQLIFTAIKDNMNIAPYDYEVFAVNMANSSNKQYTVNIHYGLYDYEHTLLAQGGKPINLGAEEIEQNGYTLDGIYTDAKYKNAWNLETDTVKGEMDLYLKWSKNNYTVTFKDNAGKVINTQKVAYREDATAPMWNEIDGYIFTGWDKDYTEIIEDTTVSATYVPETAVTMISFDKKTLSLVEGQSATITAKVNLGKDCKNNAVIWQSSDENVAVVDDNGKITAVSGGSAMIYAVSEGSGMSAQCEVTVEYKDPCAELGHKYASKVTAPTCTIDGYTTHTCTVCFDSYKDSIVKALGHTDDNGDGKCDRCGEKVNKPSNPSSGCSCKCHKSGIAKFFFKIILFFQKIFKLNKICRCKAKHY